MQWEVRERHCSNWTWKVARGEAGRERGRQRAGEPSASATNRAPRAEGASSGDEGGVERVPEDDSSIIVREFSAGDGFLIPPPPPPISRTDGDGVAESTEHLHLEEEEEEKWR